MGRSSRHHSRANSWSQRLVKALRTENIPHSLDRESKGAHNVDERVWYDQFTSTDWVHDSIANAFRVKELRSRKDVRGRLKAFFDGAQGWVLSALIGVITACIAYVVDVGEVFAFDLKYGFCSDGWYYKSEKVGPKYTLLSPYFCVIHDLSPCFLCESTSQHHILTHFIGMLP